MTITKPRTDVPDAETLGDRYVDPVGSALICVQSHSGPADLNAGRFELVDEIRTAEM